MSTRMVPVRRMDPARRYETVNLHSTGRATWLAMAAALTLSACGDSTGPEDRPLLTAAIVSNPTARPVNTTLGPGFATSGTVADELVYVSLPPGNVNGGFRATIRNPRSGAAVEVALLDGGFDPVPIEAAAGDVLELDVQVTWSDAALLFTMTVPPRRLPVVVRTDPPPRKRDVPLNASMLVVFSEPMDPALLTGGAVQLSQGTTPVAGRVEFADNAQLTVAFLPSAPLTPETTYHLTITEASRDLQGDPLEATVTVQFVSAPPPPEGRMAFWSGRDNAIYAVNADGSGLDSLWSGPTGGRWAYATWSPDGTRVAIGSRYGDMGVWVANADGSDATQLTASGYAPAWSPDGTMIALVLQGLRVMSAEGSEPAPLTSSSPWEFMWSPDGTRIVFSDPAGLWVVNVDGSGLIQVATVGQSPAWSPDGTTIAFVVFGNETDPVSDIRLVRPDGSGSRTLNYSGRRPIWSPDGSRLAFTLGTGVCVVNADGSGFTRLSRTWGTKDWAPTWSPDGRHLAFVSNRDPWGTGSSDLYIMGADGSSITRLTFDGIRPSDPAWSRPLVAAAAGNR